MITHVLLSIAVYEIETGKISILSVMKIASGTGIFRIHVFRKYLVTFQLIKNDNLNYIYAFKFFSSVVYISQESRLNDHSLLGLCLF